MPARDVDDVARHRRRGGVAACSRSDQCQFPDRVALDRNRIEHAHGLGERRALGDHRRMHALLDAMRGSFGDAQELYAKAQFVGGAQVGERDGLDSFDRNRARVDLRPEGERGQDGELVRGVEAADVKGRIGLRIAKPLSFAEADLEREIVGLHARQDVVASAVENAGNPLNRVPGQALAERLDDGYAAADRGLEEQLRARSLGKRRELEAMRGEHRLVRCDDGRPARQRGLDGVERDALGAADQFDENVDVGGGGKLRCVGEVDRAAEIDPPVILCGGRYRRPARIRALPASPLRHIAAEEAEPGSSRPPRDRRRPGEAGSTSSPRSAPRRP